MKENRSLNLASVGYPNYIVVGENLDMMDPVTSVNDNKVNFYANTLSKKAFILIILFV